MPQILTAFIVDDQVFMMRSKGHKVTATDPLGVIPEALMNHLSEHTGVDHYTKVLHGKKMFYLFMYGIPDNDRLSQRTLEDTFNDSIFRVLFGLDEDERIRHSSLSGRLGRTGPRFTGVYIGSFQAVTPISNGRSIICSE